jgi:membrane-associated phospholipid phosphatase
LKINKFAKAISYIFDGSFISIPAYLIINIFMLERAKEVAVWTSICVLFGSIMPFVFVVFLYKKKLITDLHVPRREDRLKPLLVSNVSYLLGYFVFFILKAPVYLKALFFTSFLTTVLLTIITSFWKISFHTSWITFTSITYYVFFGKWMLFIFLFVPLVAWARVKIKRHTVSQVIAGSLITFITAAFGYSFFGLLNIFL